MANQEWQVGASSDDCRVYELGIAHPPWDTMAALTDEYFRCGVDASTMYFGGGARFTNITIPQGATISSAYFKLYPDETYGTRTGTQDTKIDGEDIDDAATFSTLGNFNARARTTASVDWIFSHTAATWAVSGDIKTVIKEIVDRPGWASGQAMVIFCGDKDGNSTSIDDVSKSWDGDSSKAPKLEITWVTAGVSIPVAMHHYSHHIGKIIRG